MEGKHIVQINRSYNLFLNSIHKQTIASYYNLDPNSTVNVLRTQLDTFIIKYHYENTPPLIRQFNLSTDLSNYIKSFLIQKYTISSQIYYPRDYPFHSPTWTLIDSTISIFEIDKQFKFYNRQLLDSWVPCMSLENDVLCYIVWVQSLL